MITDPTGSFGRFADALKAAGYATHEAYASDLKNSSNRVIREGKAWSMMN
ncbi:MAG: hypothetical protein JO308_07670 [Verrucomicrobia bacterium]|nr:hypothetical protein [Verrucomicrobiota bacterium]